LTELCVTFSAFAISPADPYLSASASTDTPVLVVKV
jgi:hypothetical protein